MTSKPTRSAFSLAVAGLLASGTALAQTASHGAPQPPPVAGRMAPDKIAGPARS